MQRRRKPTFRGHIQCSIGKLRPLIKLNVSILPNVSRVVGTGILAALSAPVVTLADIISNNLFVFLAAGRSPRCHLKIQFPRRFNDGFYVYPISSMACLLTLFCRMLQWWQYLRAPWEVWPAFQECLGRPTEDRGSAYSTHCDKPIMPPRCNRPIRRSSSPEERKDRLYPSNVGRKILKPGHEPCRWGSVILKLL